MVYVQQMIDRGDPGYKRVHLFWPEEAERPHNGTKLFATPMCGTATVQRADLLPASSLSDVMIQDYEFPEDPDGLADLINHLTVNGLMCKNCVNEYRAEIGGLRGLGRKYYPDEYDVDGTDPFEYSKEWHEENPHL